MTSTDIITILLALYGAILSTVLAMRGLKREKKLIKMIVTQDYEGAAGERCWMLRVVNMGHRPTTIVNIEVWTQDESKIFSNRGHWSSYGKIDNISEILPKTLSDGEQVIFEIPEKLIRPNKSYPLFTHVKFIATDAENREYTLYEDWELSDSTWRRRIGKKRL